MTQYFFRNLPKKGLFWRLKFREKFNYIEMKSVEEEETNKKRPLTFFEISPKSGLF